MEKKSIGWLIGIGMTLLLFLSWAVISGYILPLDQRTDQALRAIDSPLLIDLFRSLSRLNSPPALLALSLLLGTLLLAKKRFREALYLLFSLGATAGVTTLFKQTLQRLRPEERLVEIHSYSFPSWHSSTSAALALTLWFIYLRSNRLAKSKTLLGFLLLAWPILIGLSRILLHAHWLSDVLAGWSLGIVISAACYLLLFDSKVERSSKAR